MWGASEKEIATGRTVVARFPALTVWLQYTTTIAYLIV